MKQNLVLCLGVLSFFANTLIAKTILVTGGAGFIGSHVTHALLERGDAVVLIDNLNNYYNTNLKHANLVRLQESKNAHNLQINVADICDKETLEEIILAKNIDVICHLAAYGGVRFSVENPELYMRTNIIGTVNIFELAIKYGVSHVVVASSSSVYGNCLDVPFSESFKADLPCSPYAMTKRADELLAYTYHYLNNISCTCLRFFTVYGPSGRPDMAPFKFMDAIYHGRSIDQFGDGKSLRDFTYVGDIVDGVIRALDKPLGYEIINLGRGEPVYLRNFINILQDVMDKKACINITKRPKSDVEITHADISKARALLGYNPQVSLKHGLEKMYAWYIQDYLKIMQEKG